MAVTRKNKSRPHGKKIERPAKRQPPVPVFVQALTALSLCVLSLVFLAIIIQSRAYVQTAPMPKIVWAAEEKAPEPDLPICEPDKQPKRTIKVLASAYSSTLDQTDSTPCNTATGYDVCENYARYGAANTIASNFLPLHTVVRIPELYGDQLFVVRDRMNERYYQKIDIWMPTRPQATRFGVKYVTLEIF